MRLAEYCRGESGFLLLPIERLGPGGSDTDLAAFLQHDCAWSAGRVALLDASLSLYWARAQELAAKTGAWPRPRIRNIGLADDAAALRPYAQVLNTSTWSLYACDLDPDTSTPEFVAYLLALGDWMAVTGEVTQAPVLSASWWLVTDAAARKSFSTAAKQSQRPDADALRAVAAALPWLTNLRQRSLRPAGADEIVREIPGTGLQVPVRHEAKPPRLVDACKRSAIEAVEGHQNAWRGNDGIAVRELLTWLENDAPMLVVTGNDGEMLWDNLSPAATGALAATLEHADGVAVASLATDLALIDEHSRRFLDALSDADSLGSGDATLSEGGYAYVCPGRSIIAYNLLEPGMDRLTGPPLPYERAMLGARVLHEWAHLADEAGCVPLAVDDSRLSELRGELTTQLRAALAECAEAPAATAAADLDKLRGAAAAEEALTELLLARLPDYRSNLLARAFMSPAERETYARHNIRTMRNEYPPAELWRAAARYLYEYQYLLPGLGLTTLEDPYRYFAESTGFDSDFINTGVITKTRFDAISEALSALLGAYVVDTNTIRMPRHTDTC